MPGLCDQEVSGLPKFQSQQVRDPKNQEKKWRNYKIKGHSDSGPSCRTAVQKFKLEISLHAKYISGSMNIFANVQIGYCYDACERSSVFTGEIIADIPNILPCILLWYWIFHLFLKASANSQDTHGEQLNFMYFVCKNTRNDSKVCCPLIGLRPFWTGLVKHSPGALLPVLSLLFSAPFFSPPV